MHGIAVHHNSKPKNDLDSLFPPCGRGPVYQHTDFFFFWICPQTYTGWGRVTKNLLYVALLKNAGEDYEKSGVQHFMLNLTMCAEQEVLFNLVSWNQRGREARPRRISNENPPLRDSPQCANRPRPELHHSSMTDMATELTIFTMHIFIMRACGTSRVKTTRVHSKSITSDLIDFFPKKALMWRTVVKIWSGRRQLNVCEY